MTNPDPVQVAYDVIEDVMTPAAYDSHQGGYWLSDLPPDLLAQRIVTALRDAGHLIPDNADRIRDLLARELVPAAPGSTPDTGSTNG